MYVKNISNFHSPRRGFQADHVQLLLFICITDNFIMIEIFFWQIPIFFVSYYTSEVPWMLALEKSWSFYKTVSGLPEKLPELSLTLVQSFANIAVVQKAHFPPQFILRMILVSNTITPLACWSMQNICP